MSFDPAKHPHGFHGRWASIASGRMSKSKSRDSIGAKVERIHTQKQTARQKMARLKESTTEHHNTLMVKKKLIGKKPIGETESRLNRTRRIGGTKTTRSGGRAHALAVAEQIGGTKVRTRWLGGR